MSSRLTKTIVGAVIAVALALAVSYGLISQQTADKIQTQADQSLQGGQGIPPTPQRPAPQDPNPQAPPQQETAPQGTPPAPPR